MSDKHAVKDENGRYTTTRFCPKQHDKDVEGRTGNGGCLKCKRERDRAYNKTRQAVVPSEDFICRNGHDKRIHGVTNRGYCNECRRDSWRRYWRRKHNIEEDARYLPQLRTIRVELGLSRARMARFCGLPAGTIQLIEDKYIAVGIETQKKIVDGVVHARRYVIRERRKAGDIYGRRRTSAA